MGRQIRTITKNNDLAKTITHPIPSNNYWTQKSNFLKTLLNKIITYLNNDSL